MRYIQDTKSIFKIASKGRVLLMISAVASQILIAAPATTALPTNPNVVNGNINIQASASNMTINQSTQTGVINWGSFNIGSAASVRFNQPNVSASTLNRVVGGEMSQIAGNLSANGQIILINPNGVIFQGGSRVDVGGIVASTMNMSDQDYLNGNYRFTRDGSVGKVINQGTITTTDAGYVALLAPEILNEGVITARKGTVAFAAGDAVTLDFQGNGLLNIEIDPSTINTLIDNKALVQADGGVIYMSSKAATDAISSTISNTGTIQANSIEEKDGKIILFAHDGTMNVDGTISAKGGFVETSGKHVHIADTAKINTTTDDKSKVGTWLIDPVDFKIAASGGDMTGTALQNSLASGNVSILSSSGASGTGGDIIIDEAIGWSANTLTLSAYHSVLVNKVVSVSGTGGLTITTNTGNVADTSTTSAGYLKMKQNRSGTSGTDTFDGKINWTSSGTLTMNSKAYSLTGDGDTTGKIITTQAELAAISVGDISLAATTRYYAIANDLSLSGTWAGLGTISPSYTGFRGTIEGLGHTISGMTNSSSVTESYQGFIRYSGNATIQNLGFIGATIYSQGNTTSILAGQLNNGTIRNVFTDSTSRLIQTGTSSVNYWGGLVGYATNDSSTFVIQDSYNAATISVSDSAAYIGRAGGIAGYFWSTGGQTYALKNLYNIGNITPYGATPDATWSNINSSGIGGIFGDFYQDSISSSGLITDLKNYGTIRGGGNVGGIMGQIYISANGGTGPQPIERLSNFGTVSGGTTAGGVIGQVGTNHLNNRFIFKTLSNTASVTSYTTTQSEWYGVGGIFGTVYTNYIAGGKYVAIDTAYNSGTITSVGISGGIIGSAIGQYDPSNTAANNYGNTYLYNVYNSGAISTTATTLGSGFTAAGGIVGFARNMYFVGNSTYSGNLNYGIFNAYNSGTVTSGYTATNETVGSIIGKYYMFNDTTPPSIANVYSVTGKVANDNIIGFKQTSNGNSTSNITTFSGVTNKTATALANDTVSNLFFNGTQKWGGGSGTMPYLLGFTTPITITLGALSKTYGDANPTITYSDSYISSIAWGSAITQYSNAGNYAYTTANMFTPTFSVGSASDYAITWATTNSLTINPKTVTLTGTKTYDGAATTANTTFTVGGTVNGDSVTVSSGTATLASKNVGSQAIGSITNLSLSNSNYTLTGGSGSVTVSARPITISTTNVTKTYDGTTSASGTATATSGSLASGDTFSGGTYAFTNKDASSGNKTVTVSGVTVNDGNGGANYTITLANNTTSTINKATLTLSGSKVYDGTATFTSGVTLGGFVGSETVGYSSATASSSHVATANKYISAITLTDGTNGGLASNYQIGGSYVASGAGQNTISITAKTLTPTITNTGVTKVYTGDDMSSFAPTYSYSGFVSGDTAATLTNTTKVYNTKDVATATTITVNGLAITGITGSNSSATSDYVLDATSKTVAGTITPKTVTLSSVNIADKVYDGTTNVTSVTSSTFSGAVNGDDVNVAGTLSPFSSKDVGTYSVSVTGLALTGTHASNYVLSGTTATDSSVAITPKTVTLSATKVYDGTTSLTGAVTLGGFVGSETLTYSSATANSAHNVAGNFISAVTLADGTNGGVASNYQLPTLNNTNAAVTITPVTLSATLSNTGVTKAYDGSTSTSITPTYTVTGFVSGDTASTITNSGKVYNSKDVLTANSVTVSGLAISAITGSNSSIAADYALNTTSLSTSATINPKTLTISGLVADNKVYDGTTTATLSNWGSVTTSVGSETVVLNHDSANFSDKNKANGKTVTASGYTLADGTNGGLASNYALSSTSATTTANITVRTVTVEGSSGVSKTYDGLTSMPVGSNGYGSIGNMVNGDNLYVSGAPVYNSATVAGATTILQGTAALAGADAANYTLSWTNGTGNITRAPLTITVNNDAKFVTQADGTGYNGVSYSGFVNGETSTILTSQPVISRSNSGTNGAGTYTGVLGASATAAAANYTISYVAGNYTIVPAGQLLVTVAPSTTTYGTNAQYTISSAKYLSATDNSTIVTLNAPSVSNNNTTFTYSDGVGGTAVFTLDATNGSLSSANLLKAGNYQVGATNVSETSANFSNTLTVVGALTVDKKALTVNASNVAKVYDGTIGMNNLTLGLSGVENGDSVSISGNGTFAGKDVGTNKAYTVNSLTLDSTDSANYYLSGGNSMSGNNGEITKKTVALSALKTYDGTTGLTNNVTIDTGVTVGGVTETLTYSGATADNANVANNSTNYISAITLLDGLNGGMASNYQLPTLNHSNAAVSINKADLNIVADTPKSQVVGLPDPVFTYSATGFVNNENESVLSGALGRNGGIIPANYAITLGTLNAANYRLLLTSANYKIDPLPVVVNVTPNTIPTPPSGGGSGTGTGGGTGTTGTNGGSGTGTGTTTGTGIGTGTGGSTGSGTGAAGAGDSGGTGFGGSTGTGTTSTNGGSGTGTGTGGDTNGGTSWWSGLFGGGSNPTSTGGSGSGSTGSSGGSTSGGTGTSTGTGLGSNTGTTTGGGSGTTGAGDSSGTGTGITGTNGGSGTGTGTTTGTSTTGTGTTGSGTGTTGLNTGNGGSTSGGGTTTSTGSSYWDGLLGGGSSGGSSTGNGTGGSTSFNGGTTTTTGAGTTGTGTTNTTGTTNNTGNGTSSGTSTNGTGSGTSSGNTGSGSSNGSLTGTGSGNTTGTSSGSGNAGSTTGSSTNTTTGSSSTTSSTASGSKSTAATGNGENTALKPEGASTALFDGVVIGNTQNGSDVKAIVIQGQSSTPIPVTMLVSVKPTEGFVFAIPTSVVKDVIQTMPKLTNAMPEVTAIQSNGTPLPSWVKFDKMNMSFNASNVPAGSLPMTLSVIIGQGNVAKAIEIVLK